MSNRLLCRSVALALAMVPLLGTASVRQGYSGPITQTFTYSATVVSDCTMTLNPGGNFPFAPISGLGGNAPEATAENDADVDCESNTATLAITDANVGSLLGYVLVAGPSQIPYLICATASGTGCYTNSNTGFPVTNNGSSVTKMFGYLRTQGPHPPGTYNDTVTVTLTFS
jgi:spore coat protein U-like protein